GEAPYVGVGPVNARSPRTHGWFPIFTGAWRTRIYRTNSDIRRFTLLPPVPEAASVDRLFPPAPREPVASPVATLAIAPRARRRAGQSSGLCGPGMWRFPGIISRGEWRPLRGCNSARY